jgi:hypothetical protein
MRIIYVDVPSKFGRSKGVDVCGSGGIHRPYKITLGEKVVWKNRFFVK